MINQSLTKTIMNLADPKERIKSFDEVAKGYTLEEAINEASRCLECKHKPCVSGCPVAIDIPAFIHEIKENRIEKAYDILSSATSLPAVCGRVCPQETQCESKCVRGIKGEPVAIGALERFVADYMAQSIEKRIEEQLNLKQADKESGSESKGKIAVVGSGPAGLACAGQLVDLGYEVTIFEALHETGGVLRYGIPEFRLPKKIVDREIKLLEAKGVTIIKNVVIGRSLSLNDLKEEGYSAIFLGIGAGVPRFMNIEGENLLGVYSANEFLTRVNLMKAYKEESETPVYLGQNVAVVGGGNVAMDAARSAKRMGAENVYLIYRRSEEEMPARREEVEHAKEEGIIFKFLCNPVKISGDENGFVTHMTCVNMALSEADESGRRRPNVIEGSEHDIMLDSVIMSIGTLANPLIKALGVNVNKWGQIDADDNGLTSLNAVYAGGDAVTGAATVIKAMGAGKKSAYEIDELLN